MALLKMNFTLFFSAFQAYPHENKKKEGRICILPSHIDIIIIQL